MSGNASSLKPTSRTLAGFLVAAMLVSACAARRGLELPEMGDWDTRREVLGGIDHYEFNGRVGVSAGDEGFSAGLRWAQQRDRFRVTVSGPLGIGTVRLEGDGRTVTLTDKDGIRTVLTDAEADLYHRYGWTIPVESLRYWALGIPDPAQPAATEFDDDGRLARLEQRNWNVAITRYSEGGGQPMPSRLTATSSDTRVRLVIHDWSFFDH
jgi:outer membrane lipoprotein LolB